MSRTIAEFVESVRPALRDVVERVLPGARLETIEPLRPDTSQGEATTKAAGYGVPLRLLFRDAAGQARQLVFHTATANPFGHDRRADRAAEMLLGFDTFSEVPGHVAALDVGAIRLDGEGLVSLGGVGEFYLLTEFAPGHVYADELRRLAHGAPLRAEDEARCDLLARTLVDLHAERPSGPQAYRRSIRDLVGSGEGIFGIIDGYPEGVPGAPPARLAAIEARCLEWRWRLRAQEARLARIHGDFHPFNVVFDAAGGLHLLDTSRGSRGDPADDVTCMAINYVFFAVQEPGAWQRGLGRLWYRFWDVYLRGSGDREVLEVAAPFFAWRGLVLANPAWYPAIEPVARDALLGLVERVLAAERFDVGVAETLF